MGRRQRRVAALAAQVKQLQRELQESRQQAQEWFRSYGEVMRSRDAQYQKTQEMRAALVHVEQALTVLQIGPILTEMADPAFAPKGIAGTCDELRKLTGQSSAREVQRALGRGLPN